MCYKIINEVSKNRSIKFYLPVSANRDCCAKANNFLCSKDSLCLFVFSVVPPDSSTRSLGRTEEATLAKVNLVGCGLWSLYGRLGILSFQANTYQTLPCSCFLLISKSFPKLLKMSCKKKKASLLFWFLPPIIISPINLIKTILACYLVYSPYNLFEENLNYTL